jgi:hypothetical protein
MTDVTTITTADRSATLDELMLAMDVVDTLRHNEKLVEAELSQSARDDELKKRLRDLYQSQGLAVTDTILEEGIRNLKESRFTYVRPPDSFAYRLALLWVRRNRIARWAAFAAAGLATVWGVYYFGFVAPAQNAVERVRIEIADTLPRALETAHLGVQNVVQDPDARLKADALLAEGRFALRRIDAPAARKALGDLNELERALSLEYEIRVISGGRSGVWRIPDLNTNAKNYYLLVHALNPKGKPVPVAIASEETGQMRDVEIWGQRVSEDLFNAVRRDKLDDGIIQTNIVGKKERGFLKPQFSMPVEPGAITEW